jgi:hypothetical protein
MSAALTDFAAAALRLPMCDLVDEDRKMSPRVTASMEGAVALPAGLHHLAESWVHDGSIGKSSSPTPTPTRVKS